MITRLLWNVLTDLGIGFCFLLSVWIAWWTIRGSVRKVVREELEQVSLERQAELVALYAFLQGDESDERADDDCPGLMSRIRSLVREELYEHTRTTGKNMS